MRLSILFLFACLQVSAQALPETPAPHREHVDRWLTAAHGAAVTYDLATTRIVVSNGYVEKDPLTRPLIGERPSVARMTAFGSLEIVSTELLKRRYPRAGRWVQVAAIAAHVACASHNLTLRRR